MKIRKSILSMLLCLAVVFSMCFAFSGTAYAAGETTLNSGATVTPGTYENRESMKIYATPVVTKDSKDFTYNFKMPSKGTLFVQFAALSGNFYLKNYSAAYAGSGTIGGDQIYMFYVPSAGNVQLTFCAYNYSGNAQGGFGAYYAAGTKSFSKANNSFYLGSGSSTGESSFKVKVPSNGYLKVTAIDAASSYSSVSLRTKGFKGWDYVSESNNYYTYIGVKKGTYTIRLKNAKLYKVETKFTKVKETSAKTSKSSAASIKKKATNKGIIPANKTSKKHWYKIKNPKNQKMKLVVNAKKMSDGGSYGDLKITVYFPDGASSSGYVSAGKSDTFTVKYGRIGTSKALKGTYRIKVESENGANGFYTLKWK